MTKMALKKYGKDQKTEINATIKSGVESGDSGKELMIVEPIEKHPEMPVLVRAVDPITKWKGWVKYTPSEPDPEPDPEPTQKEIEAKEFAGKLHKLDGYMVGVEMGIINENDSRIITLRDELKTKFRPEYINLLVGRKV